MLGCLVLFRWGVKLVSSLLRILATCRARLLFWFDWDLLSLLLCRSGRSLSLCGQWRSNLLFYGCGRVILGCYEVDADSGVFVIVQAHLSVIFIIVLVFKKGDPLRIRGKPTIENDVLRDRYRAYVCFVLAKTFGDNCDLVLRNKWT